MTIYLVVVESFFEFILQRVSCWYILKIGIIGRHTTCTRSKCVIWSMNATCLGVYVFWNARTYVPNSLLACLWVGISRHISWSSAGCLASLRPPPSSFCFLSGLIHIVSKRFLELEGGEIDRWVSSILSHSSFDIGESFSELFFQVRKDRFFHVDTIYFHLCQDTWYIRFEFQYWMFERMIFYEPHRCCNCLTVTHIYRIFCGLLKNFHMIHYADEAGKMVFYAKIADHRVLLFIACYFFKRASSSLLLLCFWYSRWFLGLMSRFCRGIFLCVDGGFTAHGRREMYALSGAVFFAVQEHKSIGRMMRIFHIWKVLFEYTFFPENSKILHNLLFPIITASCPKICTRSSAGSTGLRNRGQVWLPAECTIIFLKSSARTLKGWLTLPFRQSSRSAPYLQLKSSILRIFEKKSTLSWMHVIYTAQKLCGMVLYTIFSFYKMLRERLFSRWENEETVEKSSRWYISYDHGGQGDWEQDPCLFITW